MDEFRHLRDKDIDAHSLEEKLNAAYSNIRFLQVEHAATIRGLHDEIDRLQNMHRDLEFRIEIQDIPLGNDFVKNKNSLDEKIDQLVNENEVLKRKLYESSHAIEILDQKQKLLKWQQHQELEERDATIIRLQQELETKCSTISHLSFQLHRKKKSFLRRFSFSSESTSLPPSMNRKTSLNMQCSNSRKVEFQKDANSLDLYEPEWDSFHCSNSSFSDRSTSDDDSIPRKPLGFGHNNLPYLEKVCMAERRSSDIKLPPINFPPSETTRRLVRQQIRLDKLASKTSVPLAIDQVSSPEIALKRLNKAQ